MRGTLTVRSLEIGVNPPKIIVPIVGKTAEDILAKAAELRTSPADIVEWRADYLGEAAAPGQIPAVRLAQILEALHQEIDA